MSLLRFLVDVNVGLAVADSLRHSGHDEVFVGELDWSMPGVELLSLANREKRIIITMDTDFGELVYRSGLPHAGVLLFRASGATRDEKVQIIQEIIDRYGQQITKHFCVYREGKLRVRP
jgi:predicted nuclease of predicted toxin-antitoxin system